MSERKLGPIDLGRDAQNVLDSEAFNVAAENFAARLMHEWSNTSPDQTALRESIWQQFKTADALSNELRKLVDDGKIAESRRKQ